MLLFVTIVLLKRPDSVNMGSDSLRTERAKGRLVLTDMGEAFA